MVQNPLVNIGDLVWVKIQLGKDHYTSLTAFILSVNYWGENISSYNVEYFEINTSGGTLYGLDYGNMWGKLDT